MADFGGFGTASQFAGGGFMANHAENSPADRKQLDGQMTETVRALTVSQLTKAQAAADIGEELFCDGRPIKNVTLVGIMTHKTVTETFLSVGIYDGSGTIEAKLFLEDSSPPPIQSVPEGTYVRVYGNFRGASVDNPSALGAITAFVVRPVQDHNEVVHWNMSTVFEHMYVTQPQGGAAKPMAAPGGAPQASQFGGAAPMMAAGGGGIGGAGAGACTAAFLQAVRELDQGELGCPTAAVMQRLSAQFPPDQVNASYHELINGAQMYTTDEHHVKAIA